VTTAPLLPLITPGCLPLLGCPTLSGSLAKQADDYERKSTLEEA